MIVLRDESLSSVWEEFHGLRALLPDNHHHQHWGGRAQHFTWVNDIDYAFRQDGVNRRLRLHLVGCEEAWQAVDEQGTLLGLCCPVSPCGRSRGMLDSIRRQGKALTHRLHTAE
jgi:hypothetical protein